MLDARGLDCITWGCQVSALLAPQVRPMLPTLIGAKQEEIGHSATINRATALLPQGFLQMIEIGSPQNLYLTQIARRL